MNVTTCDTKNNATRETENADAAQPTEIVTSFLERWIARDVEACLDLLAGDASYTLHIEESLLPFAGTTTGREEIGAQLRTMLRDWDYLVFRPMPAKLHGDADNEVRNRVEFMFRHKASGELLNGFMRLVWTVEDGHITSINEYHDTALVEAFLRLHAVQDR